MIKKREIAQERNRWIFRVILTFIIVVAIMIGAEKFFKFFGFPEKAMMIIFFVLGVAYIFQIFSYRKIKCPICGASFFNQFNIFISVPKECRNCKTRIE
jgi:hypothetical protein